MKSKSLISLIIPVFNEEEVLPQTFERIRQLSEKLSEKYDFEFIFTDNHSSDNTFALLTAFNLQDARVKAIRFSRNFGYQRSILAGYLASKGDALVQLDCDLEDPPELIEEFLREWEVGHEVVYGVRLSRIEPKFKTIMRKIFYRLIDALSEDKLPHDAGDFRLLDRKIVEVLRHMNDASPYLRGMIAGFGFTQKGIEYHRDKRHAGKSKFNLTANLGLALTGILSHSVLPLRIASVFGLILTMFSFLSSIVYLGLWFLKGDFLPAGFTTLVILLLFSVGINALFLGILGEYIASIHKQVKAGPNVLVEKMAGFGPETITALGLDIKAT